MKMLENCKIKLPGKRGKIQYLAKKYVWDQNAQSHFDQLKKDIINNAGLFLPVQNQKIYIQTDSSESSLGGVVFQYIENERRPIICLSRNLTKSEKNAHIFRKEVNAILYVLTSIKQLLQYMDIEIITDARGVLACKMSKSAHSPLFRLSLELSQFNFSIRHICGSENTLPDALTRNSGVDSTNGPPPMKLPEACKILELVKIPTNTVFSQAEVRKWLLDIGLLSLLKSDKKSKRTNLPILNASKITPQPISLKNSKPVLLENNKFLIEKKVKSSKFANFFNLEQIKNSSTPFEDINLTNKVIVSGTLSIDDFSKLQKLCPEIKR